MSNKLLKKACVVAAASMLPFATMAGEEGVDWGISGWINEGVLFYDDGIGSDAVQTADNGTTLGTRITLSGSADLPGTNGWTAGFDITLEPNALTNTPLIALTQTSTNVAGTAEGPNNYLSGVTTLGQSIYVAGNWGKVTFGTQSMPTDNIAVLADPSLTLWQSISPVFRGNGFTIQGVTGSRTTWGSFLSCLTTPVLSGAGGIGIDCNGIYRNGVRYDLPAFGPVSVAIGYANDDIYDIAAKYNGELGRIKTILHLGYAINQGAATVGKEAENFQAQLGLMDPETGLYGTFAYQNEEADGLGSGVAGVGDDTDAYWFKGGIKKTWFAPGDTALSFQYGSYNDEFGTGDTTFTITGSEVERIGFEVSQYFGSKLIIYGTYENLDLDVDCGGATAAGCNAAYGGAKDLDLFALGLTYFF